MLPALFQFLMATLNIIVVVIVTVTSTAVQVNALPITSNPIESTAENLAWQAWIMMSPHQQNLEKSRKVTPKSIFILPNRVQIPAPVLTPDAQQWATDPGSGGGGLYTAIECPPGQRQYESRCIPTLDIDREKLLLQELQTLLLQQDGFGNGDNNNNNNDYDYDYNYEDPVGAVNSSAPMPMSVRSSSEKSSSEAPSIRDSFDDVVQLPNDDSPLKFNIFKAKFPTSPEINEQNQSHAVGPKSITNISDSTHAEISMTKNQSVNEQQLILPLDRPGGNTTMSNNTSSLLSNNSSHYPMTDIDTIILPAASTFDHSQRVSLFSNDSALKLIATPSGHKNDENDDGDVTTKMKWMALNITELLKLDSLLPFGNYPQATNETETSTIKTTTSTAANSISEATLSVAPSISTTIMSPAEPGTPIGKITLAPPTFPTGVTANVTPTPPTSFLTRATAEQSDLPTKITITPRQSESMKPGEIIDERKKLIQKVNEKKNQEDPFDRTSHQTNAYDQQTISASLTTGKAAAKTTNIPVPSSATFHTLQPQPSLSEATVNNFQLEETTTNEQQDQHQPAAATAPIIQLQDFVDLMKGQEQKSKVKPVEKQTDSRKHNGNDFYHELLSAVDSALQETNTQQQHTGSDADYLGHDDQLNYQSLKDTKPSNSEREVDERRKLVINTKFPLQQHIENKTTAAMTTIVSTAQTETKTETTLSAIGVATELRDINAYIKKRQEENATKRKLQNAKPTKAPAATTTSATAKIDKNPAEISTDQDSNKSAATTAILPPVEIATKMFENVQYDESGTPTIQDAVALTMAATVTTMEIGAATTNLFTGTPSNTTIRTGETSRITATTSTVSKTVINLKDDTKKLTTTTPTTSTAKGINNKTKSDKIRQFVKKEAAAAVVMNAGDSRATARTIPSFSPQHFQSFSPTTPTTRATHSMSATKTTTAEPTTVTATTDSSTSNYWWVPIDWQLDRPTNPENLSSDSTDETSRRNDDSNSTKSSSTNPPENQTQSLLLRFWSAFPGHQTKIKE